MTFNSEVIMCSMQRDERVQETAMLYGIGPLQEARAKQEARATQRKARDLSTVKPAPKSLGPVNAFQSIKGWTPQVSRRCAPHPLC